MKRRDFIALGAASVLGTGLAPAAWAQQPGGRKRVGVLYAAAAASGSLSALERANIDAMRTGLKDEGFTDGTNVILDVRGSGNDPGVTRAAARELAGGSYDVLIGVSTPATAALLAETRTIPIVASNVSDPIGSGFVQSFARPGGNVTALTNVEPSMGGKWVEVLHEIAPGVRRAVLMTNPDAGVGNNFWLPSFRAAAAALGIEPVAVDVRTVAEIDAAIAGMAKTPGSGLVVPPDGYTNTNRRIIIDAVARENLPAVYMFPTFPDDGGLISYGSDSLDIYRQTGSYAGLLLKGTRPADLPVQAPRKYVLSINLKTAKAQGITIPPSLMVLADKVIE